MFNRNEWVEQVNANLRELKLGEEKGYSDGLLGISNNPYLPESVFALSYDAGNAGVRQIDNKVLV